MITFPQFVKQYKEQRKEDGPSYEEDQEDIYHAYIRYVRFLYGKDFQMPVPVDQDRLNCTTIFAAIKHFFRLSSLEMMKEWKQMSVEDRVEIRQLLIEDGYINIAGLPHHAEYHGTPMLPAVIPANIVVKQLSAPPPTPLESVIPEVDEGGGYMVGDIHPAVKAA